MLCEPSPAPILRPRRALHWAGALLSLLMALTLAPAVAPAQVPPPANQDRDEADDANPDAPFAPPPLSDEEVVLNLTLDFYTLIAADSSESCDRLAAQIQRFLDANDGLVRPALRRLAVRASEMTSAEKAALADFFAHKVWGDERVALAQTRLYACLHSIEIQGKARPMDRAMRRYYDLHRSLLLAFVGSLE